MPHSPTETSSSASSPTMISAASTPKPSNKQQQPHRPLVRSHEPPTAPASYRGHDTASYPPRGAPQPGPPQHHPPTPGYYPYSSYHSPPPPHSYLSTPGAPSPKVPPSHVTHHPPPPPQHGHSSHHSYHHPLPPLHTSDAEHPMHHSQAPPPPPPGMPSHRQYQPHHPPPHQLHSMAPPSQYSPPWKVREMRISPEQTPHSETLRGGGCTCKKSRYVIILCLRLFSHLPLNLTYLPSYLVACNASSQWAFNYHQMFKVVLSMLCRLYHVWTAMQMPTLQEYNAACGGN